MQREHFVAVAIRLFAIFVVIYTLRYGASLLPFVGSSEAARATWTFFAFFAIPPLLTAAILWLFPLSLARALLPKGTATETKTAWSIADVQIVALSVLGVWVLATALPDVFHWVVYGHLMTKYQLGELSPENMGNIWATAIELVIGFWLVFGAKGISGIISIARTAGTKA
jgi:hypothetical protein